jgi:glutathione peroxidase
MLLVKKLISSLYKVRIKISKVTGWGIHILENKNHVKASIDFYSLHATANSGQEIELKKYEGKKILLVNLASQCGYTPQYKELEQLHQQNKNVIILGFPSNNFGAQEPGNDERIAEFCKINYGVTFPLFKKDDVKGKNKQPIYRWLTDADKNGWNNQEPQWNFYKYLVDENGNLSKIFSSSVSPLDITL